MENDTSLDPLRAETQARLAAIIESSDDAIVSKTLEGIIQTWNAGAERIFGWTAEEVVGKPITIIIPPDRLDEEPKILAQIRSGQRIDHFETIRQTKDGRLLNVSATISPIRDHTGRVIGVSKIARDITLQKRFQQELRAAVDAAEEARSVAERAKEEAEKANRAKDSFLSMLSHELRTPLTPVLAAISFMERDARLPADVADQVEMIRRNVETEARLVDDLLDLTRIARGKIELHPELIDAHAAIRDVVAMLHQATESKRIRLAMALRARRSHTWADPGRFQQMLLNLLSNAVKFTPHDGAITVRTANDNERIKIEIRDSGIGIEPEMLPRLFRPFEQGERTRVRQYGGLGLGLSIVKSLADMHHASIVAASEGRDRGATFTLSLSAVATPTPTPVSAPAAGNARGKAYRVLLVEDHDDTRSVLGRLMTSFGYVVITAGSVKEAVEAAENQPFDILISDIGLPDGSGIELMKHLAARSKVTGIALSGFGQDEDVQRSREAGFATHLIKPVNLQALQAAIENVAP